MRVALSIAGSDSGCGAGVQADLKTFAAHGVYGVCAITALTAQNTRGVSHVDVAAPRTVRAQVDSVAADFPIDAVKTGMLATSDIVDEVADAIGALGWRTVVVDPVMVAKSGDSLLDARALDAVRLRLLPRASVVTPNLPEAAVLADMRVETPDDAETAARRIGAMGAHAVIVKGGHAVGDVIVDILWDGVSIRRFPHARVPGTSTHGTGCTFAAALAAHLALGVDIAEALPKVQRYVAEAIRHAPALGHGHGPMHHFWQMDKDPRRP